MSSQVFDETTREIVTPDGTLPGGHRQEVIVYGGVAAGPSANVNLADIAGTVPDVGTGNAGAGTQRVVLASNQPPVAVDTELPAAAALNEGMSNPTAPGVAAFGATWNGATWDRLRSP